MKTTLLTLSILFCLSFSVKSQLLQFGFCFDTTDCSGYSESNSEPVLTIENTPDNLWQIGQAQKNNFTSGYNSLKAIVTDLTNPYASNNTSAFVISWTTDQPSNSIHWANSRIQFAYNVDSDTLTDYGSIEFSPDSGATWIDLLDVDDPTYGSFLDWETSGPNGTMPPVLSGNSNGWIYYSLNMQPLSTELAIPAGTTILWRFSFTSDGNQTNKDGLMFDNIGLVVTPPLSVSEISADNIQISPNPVISTMDIHFSGSAENMSYRIYSSEGKLIKEFENQNADATLDLNTLDTGIYYLSIHGSGNQLLASKKFIKQ
ncbi:MAG: T9SS type A sorting domain-containing protein [Fluviicola sp.]